jgi:hypothetical protein
MHISWDKNEWINYVTLPKSNSNFGKIGGHGSFIRFQEAAQFSFPGTGEGVDDRMVEERIQVWCIWYIVRTFVNGTKYPYPEQQ